ncbi:MAG: hypothetical protein ACD_79C00293G0002 [uncultured bacterium]|nr:MAG: hypothetical protein ACD_79C00293G0002 [uncultured bacterium]
MSGNLIDVNESNFQETVKTGLTLVDFWAPWCGPCQMQTPILEKLAVKLGGKVKIAKVNVDNAQNLAANFGVQSIPTIILFKDGEQVQKMIGLQNENALASLINSQS